MAALVGVHMPHASLTFTLPDERHYHLCAVHSSESCGTLRDEHLTGLLKHDGFNSYSAMRLAAHCGS